MKEKLIYRGAEAELWETKYLDLPVVIKKRIEKPYKQKDLDKAIRQTRTKNEAKLLSTARNTVNTPHVYEVKKTTIMMEQIPGKTMKELFYSGKTELAERIGKEIRRMHDKDIIHNDLTTSNIIFSEGKVFFIDFGLGKISCSLEDKATDLVVFKKMLSSTHYDVFEEVWPRVLEGYANNKILSKINEIEKRARYL